MNRVGLTLSQWAKAKGGSFTTNMIGQAIDIRFTVGTEYADMRCSFDLAGIRSLEQVFEKLTGKVVICMSTSETGFTAKWIEDYYKVGLEEGLNLVSEVVANQKEKADKHGFLPRMANEVLITVAEYLEGKTGCGVTCAGTAKERFMKYLKMEDVKFEDSHDGIRFEGANKRKPLEDFKVLVEKWMTMPYTHRDVKKTSVNIEMATDIDTAMEILRTNMVGDLNVLVDTDLKALFWGGGREVTKTKRSTFASNFPREQLTLRDFIEQTIGNASGVWGLEKVVAQTNAANKYAFVVGMILRAKGQMSFDGEMITFIPVRI